MDAQRNRDALLDAAAAVFARAGVDAPIRAIAAEAGVGVATLYRHFPERSDLVVAVYNHQIESLANAGTQLMRTAESPADALREWVDLFVDFLATKHGLASAMGSGNPTFRALHAHFLERIVPVCGELLAAGVAAGQLRAEVDPYELMHGIGNICISTGDERYEPRRIVALVLSGLRTG
ncbi:TetR/AcrR family transcriptional regulator [Saccharomonospora cyanea]|uniref:Transcriptional regulator n=1 Tax=Saccharomonospora cyanea NA-134 TaxID=882082 RepID=H5XK38_9PSEU|nr:TetR/AcrR family transcriptional regulator [Saccharomonospora cyanea]EHR62993.1 transcriptional regulator [Saccharomonospora cyanea NA-134]